MVPPRDQRDHLLHKYRQNCKIVIITVVFTIVLVKFCFSLMFLSDTKTMFTWMESGIFEWHNSSVIFYFHLISAYEIAMDHNKITYRMYETKHDSWSIHKQTNEFHTYLSHRIYCRAHYGGKYLKGENPRSLTILYRLFLSTKTSKTFFQKPNSRFLYFMSFRLL